MSSGAGVSEWDDVKSAVPLDPTVTVLVATIQNTSGHVVHRNTMPLSPPTHMRLMNANVTVHVEGLRVTVTSDAPALFVVLTTAAQGRFEDNAFLLKGGSRTLDFIPFMSDQEDTLRRTVRVEHLAEAVVGSF